jgi:hypothetical protein
MSTREDLLEIFERWCPTALAVGGIGILGTTVVGSLDVAGVIQSSPRLAMGPLLFGLWFVFGGLIGYYPRVAEGAPRLSLGGVGSAGIAWVAWTATMLAAIFVDVTSERTFADPGSWAPPLLTVAFILALLSFLCYGVASAWSETPSGTLGVLLLVPVAAFLGQAVLLASKIVTGEVTAVLQLAFGALIAIALFVISYLLWNDTERAVSSESRVDPTT